MTLMPGLRPSDALPAALREDTHAALLAPLLGRLAGWRTELRARLSVLARSTAFDLAAIEEAAAAALARQWLWMSTPALVLAMHRARARGELAGETPELRYRSFVTGLVGPEVLAECPVLLEQIEDRARQSLEATAETLARFAADAAPVGEEFFGGDPGPLVALEARAGDLHADGRSVSILRFASGARLVYKPRSMATDARFQKMLEWLNDRGAPEAFRTMRVLDRGGYGWMEFAVAAPCATAAALERYHVRLGALLAVLHLTRAVDMHFENLVAAGEHPVVVDLETLFHQVPPSLAARPAAERVLTDALNESVLRVGLLPFRVGADDGFANDNLGALAADAGRMSPDPVIRWENVGRDDMRAVREPLPLTGSAHRANLAGEPADPAESAAAIARGFEAMSLAFLQRRRELDGVLARFAEDRVRAVLRPTRVYGLLLDACWHPDLLRDRAARDRFFARLGIVSDAPELAPVMPFESHDLWAGDVPVFTTRPGSQDLWTSRGERLTGFFRETSLEAARRRLAELGTRDIERETWLVRASLAMDSLNRDRGRWATLEPVLPAEMLAPDTLRERLLAEAAAIGEWFERMGVGDPERATWIALDFRAMQWTVNAAATDLYSGTPGIVLFLAHLGALTGDPVPTQLARRGLRGFLERLERPGAPSLERGLFQGLGGAIYTLAHLAALWNEAELAGTARALLPALARELEEDEELDVIAGSAGVIAALLALEQLPGCGGALDLARRCGGHLVSRARSHVQGLIWTHALSGDEPVSGFSHGAAGIAYSLLRLGERTGEEVLRTRAREALRAESAVLAPRLERWREEPAGFDPGTLPRYAEKTLSTSWCHGLAGLALARRAAGDPELAQEAATFLAHVKGRGFGRSHCLCHGDLGSLDILDRAARETGDAGAAREVARRVEATLEGAGRGGWRCGTMSEVEAPGLMNGLAGIGYGLLRLAAPTSVPSILALDPPSPRGA